jgi:hypothetical protein
LGLLPRASRPPRVPAPAPAAWPRAEVRARLPSAASAAAGALCALALAATFAAGQARPSTIGVEEIRPGMRGYGLTVFRGEQPERFDVTVIDVLRNFRPGQDLILVRTDHPILDHASTVAGCSGSPIYFDDRLAGAYAYGWPFGKDPVAGVTPIGSMLAEMRRARRPDAFPVAPLEPIAPASARPRASASPAAAPPDAASLAGLPPFRGDDDLPDAFAALRALATRAGLGPALGGRDDGAAPRGLRRAATPLLLGGVSDSALALLADALAPFDLVPLQAGGGGGRGAASAPAAGAPRFVDGGAIGVQLARGDVNMTAVGTVTHVAGNQLIAFGHPMMNAGETGLPTATARVLHVLASEQRSFKIAEPVAPLGALVNDRQAAIVVDTAVRPATVPLRLRVRGPEGLPRGEWNVQVAAHRVLTPVLVLATLTSALEATASDQTDVMFEARSSLRVEGRRDPVETVDRGYSPSGVASARTLSRLRLFAAIEAVYGNPFEKRRIEGVDLEVTLRFARDVAQIVSATVADDEVDPGERVPVRVRLRTFDRTDELRTVEIVVPEQSAGSEIEVALEPGDDVALERPEPRNLEDLLRIVTDRFPETELVASTKLPSRGLRFRGHVVRSLPASALEAFASSNVEGPTGSPFVTQSRQRIDVGRVLAGSARVRLRVRAQPRGH